jgi:hypothetical protein
VDLPNIYKIGIQSRKRTIKFSNESMPRCIDPSNSLTKSDTSFSGYYNFVAVKQGSYQSANNSFAIPISIGRRGVNKIATCI